MIADVSDAKLVDDGEYHHDHMRAASVLSIPYDGTDYIYQWNVGATVCELNKTMFLYKDERIFNSRQGRILDYVNNLTETTSIYRSVDELGFPEDGCSYKIYLFVVLDIKTMLENPDKVTIDSVEYDVVRHADYDMFFMRDIKDTTVTTSMEFTVSHQLGVDWDFVRNTVSWTGGYAEDWRLYLTPEFDTSGILSTNTVTLKEAYAPSVDYSLTKHWETDSEGTGALFYAEVFVAIGLVLVASRFVFGLRPWWSRRD